MCVWRDLVFDFLSCALSDRGRKSASPHGTLTLCQRFSVGDLVFGPSWVWDLSVTAVAVGYSVAPIVHFR